MYYDKLRKFAMYKCIDTKNPAAKVSNVGLPAL